jgi:hypothetical protein
MAHARTDTHTHVGVVLAPAPPRTAPHGTGCASLHHAEIGQQSDNTQRLCLLASL